MKTRINVLILQTVAVTRRIRLVRGRELSTPPRYRPRRPPEKETNNSRRNTRMHFDTL